MVIPQKCQIHLGYKYLEPQLQFWEPVGVARFSPSTDSRFEIEGLGSNLVQRNLVSTKYGTRNSKLRCSLLFKGNLELYQSRFLRDIPALESRHPVTAPMEVSLNKRYLGTLGIHRGYERIMGVPVWVYTGNLLRNSEIII